MDNIVAEKLFLKENEGVRVTSNDLCAIFLLNDFELNQFTYRNLEPFLLRIKLAKI